MDGLTIRVPVYVSIAQVVDEANPPAHMACDWYLSRKWNPFGIRLLPLEIYRKMNDLKKKIEEPSNVRNSDC